MARFELLNIDAHSQLKLTDRVENQPHCTPIIISEFPIAAASTPIMFTKEPETGNFFAIAVLSLKVGEPPLKTLEERGGFNPLSFQCKGFSTSGQQIAIDRDNPRFNDSEGIPLFTETRQPADNLRQIQTALGKYVSGVEATQQFINKMNELKLIEPIDMTLRFDNNERLSLKGLYTISLDAINDLDDANIIDLFRSGYLQLAYLVANSLKQFNLLAHIRNQKLSSGL